MSARNTSVWFFTMVVLVILPQAAKAQLIWVGGVSSDIFDESNWDLSSSSVTMIEPDMSIADDVQIGPGPFANDPIIPELPGQQRFQLDDGRTLTLDAVTLTVEGNDGVGGAPETADGPTVNVMGGAQFNPFFVVNGVLVNIDGTSSATFGGGGNPINLSTVDLSLGGKLAFLQEDPSEYVAEHLSKTFVAGSPAVENVNISIVGDGVSGSIVTAIPEPSTFLLGALAGLSLLSRRRIA